MEKNELVGKTKEELVDIALEKEKVEKELREELDKTSNELAHTAKRLQHKEKIVLSFCIIYILMSVSLMILLFEK